MAENYNEPGASTETPLDDPRYTRYRRDAQVAGNLDKWQERAQEARRYLGGDQWRKADRDDMSDKGKPSLVFNHMHKVVTLLSGSEVSNRFEPRFWPVGLEDTPSTDAFQAFVRMQRSLTYSAHEDSAAFKDMVTTGVGCCEMVVDSSEDPGGRIGTVRVPPGEYAWDPGARRQNLADASFILRGRYVTRDDFNVKWPDFKNTHVERGPFVMGEEHGAGGGAELYDSDSSWMYMNRAKGDLQRNRGDVLIVDHQYRVPETALFYRDPLTGVLDFVWPEDMGRFEQAWMEQAEQFAAQGQPPPPIPVFEEGEAMRYRRCLFAGQHLLESSPLPDSFSYFFMTGFDRPDPDDESRLEWYGLFDLMKDPQDWSNKALSQIIHIISMNPKGTVIHGPNVFTNPEEAAKAWARPGSMVRANVPNFKDQIEVVSANEIPLATMNLYQLATQMVADVPGVNLDYLGGQVEDLRRTSGSSLQAVQRSAQTMLAPLFDSLKRYRSQVGMAYLKFTRAYIEPGVLVRVLGEAQRKVLTLTLTSMFARYDVTVDESPTVASSQLEVWQTLTDQGSLPFLVQNGLLDPKMIPQLMPGLTSQVREQWLNYLVQREQMMQQQAMAAQGQPPAAA